MATSSNHLKRTLGATMLWGLGVGYVISGMYFGWNLGLEKGGTLGMGLATLFITLMYITFTFSYTELACAIPKAGGAFDYADRTLGKEWAFFAGMAQNIEFIFAPPAIAFAIGAYFNLFFPQFSILDPEVIRSIPKKQIANGIADAYTHVLEQYMTYRTTATLQERFMESILQTLQEVAPQLMSEEFDYDAAANYMWCCTMALNGLISKGVVTDWAVHAMGHELTARFGIDHARTLAIIAPSHYRYNFDSKKEKLAQYAERAWHINEGSTAEKAEKGIQKLEEFFHSIGIKTQLSEYTTAYEGTAEKIEKTFTSRHWLGLGEHKKLSPQDVYKIVEMSY